MSKKKFKLQDEFNRWYSGFVEESSSISCGITELSCVAPIRTRKDFEESIYALMRDGVLELRGSIYPIVIFSDIATKITGGKLVAKLIEEYGLGKIIKSPVVTNPNTGNRIAMYMWVTNKKALFKFYQDARNFLAKNGDLEDDEDDYSSSPFN